MKTSRPQLPNNSWAQKKYNVQFTPPTPYTCRNKYIPRYIMHKLNTHSLDLTSCSDRRGLILRLHCTNGCTVWADSYGTQSSQSAWRMTNHAISVRWLTIWYLLGMSYLVGIWCGYGDIYVTMVIFTLRVWWYLWYK